MKTWISLLLLSGASISTAYADNALSQGEYLARASDCVACHTRDSSKPFAGGVKFKLPMGTLYSTNITPDHQYGIGNYSERDFARAVRQGIAKDGHQLYPAMPYPSYAKLSDQDIHALYSYFMQQVKPIAEPSPSAQPAWLLSLRWPLKIWNWINQPAPPSSDEPAKQSEQWQRGAWLVEGPGHCGACHTPRGWMLQETGFSASDKTFLTGGKVEGWTAPSLRQLPYDAEQIAELLKKGYNRTSAVSGPMVPVISHSTQYLTDGDRAAIGLYLSALPAEEVKPSKSYRQTAKVDPEGNYQRYCATCHGRRGEGTPEVIPSLQQNPLVSAADPAGLLKVLLNGGEIPLTEGTLPWAMPGYAEQLSDKQLADLASYIRGSFGNHADKVTVSQVIEARHKE